jgi:glycosyltransferase involved in cell wall biosynthesis
MTFNKGLLSMHILHVIDSLARGGAERALVEIANRSAADGYRVSVCVTRTNCDLAGDLRPEISLTVLNRRKRFDRGGMHRFAALVKKESVDVLHVYNRWTLSFVSFVKTLRLIPPGIPIVFNEQYGIYLDPSVPPWFRWWAKHWITHYVGVYEALGDWAKEAGIPREKISVICNALSADRIQNAVKVDIRREFNIPDDVLVGIVVGGLRKEKGTDVLLSAIAGSEARDTAKFLIVGGERDHVYAQTCYAQSRQLRLDDTVTFTGERADVPSLLHGSDFALIPSRSEGSPNVLVEYMFAGLPFVSTTVGGFAPQLIGMGIPEFVTPGNASALAAAIDRLVCLSPEERQRRGEMGQTAAYQHFEISQVIPAWYAVYGAVVRSNHL